MNYRLRLAGVATAGPQGSSGWPHLLDFRHRLVDQVREDHLDHLILHQFLVVGDVEPAGLVGADLLLQKRVYALVDVDEGGGRAVPVQAAGGTWAARAVPVGGVGPAAKADGLVQASAHPGPGLLGSSSMPLPRLLREEAR
eukprot:CAMPEP_0175753308 /NCGR_PEP_ID=MMETSP0097-20121207/62234_1 /TAXON_ID=311494 /ORGANISM="Alexandrium monilatum, Strain CCMP3105" /LENGTH=140 /DNA_ID=CAMNT_0017062161 /DNA_START=86 /DNA_END=508 /DNA_ORIENTATION=+